MKLKFGMNEATNEATNLGGELIKHECMARTVISHLVVNGFLNGPCF